MLNLTTIRETWSRVEATDTATLLWLRDDELVQQLYQQVETRLALSDQESEALTAYLGSKVTLIRDLAESRQVAAPRLQLLPATKVMALSSLLAKRIECSLGTGDT